MKKNILPREITIYQTKSGALELKGDILGHTIWATQKQIADIFCVERSVTTKHINNIFKSKEIDKKSNVQKLHIANSDKPVIFYSLDIILAVGYRTNSAKAIEFRRWASSVLKAYIREGYVINRKKINQNYKAFIDSVSSIQTLLPGHVILDPKNILELVKEFAHTFTSLEAYDKDKLKTIGTTRKAISLTGIELTKAIQQLKKELISKKEATPIFAQERVKDSISGIVGNVMQSFGGKALYPTLEEKAAHLLYFVVKNHPFVDGNKRSGAFAFIWFLRKTKSKGARNINPTSLTALTILVAESEPKRKEQMIALITQLLK